MKLKFFLLIALMGFLQVPQLPAQTGEQDIEIPTLDLGTRWGVRTNMLYNTLNFINVGVECNTGNHWGWAAELICPWWNADDNHRTTRMLCGGIEGRYYWKGWKEKNRILSGPYVGFHANGGIYDLVRNNEGVQSEAPFWMGGAVIGYGLMISNAWRFDMSLGLGGMYTPYNHYHVKDGGNSLVTHYSGNYTYFGPTKAELSFVLLLK